MDNRKVNYIVRLIPAVILIGAIITLAFYWTYPENRDGAFYYFIILLVYSGVMLFFSDIIFLRKKPLLTRIPITVIAAIHIGYVAALVILRLIFSNLDSMYFVLATLIATGIQVSLSLWIYNGVAHITAHQEKGKQTRNISIGRDILLSNLTDSVKKVPELSGDYSLMQRVEIFTNAWKYSPEQDNEHTAPLTSKINAAIQSLTDAVSAGSVDAAGLTERMTEITSFIEQRQKLSNIR